MSPHSDKQDKLHTLQASSGEKKDKSTPQSPLRPTDLYTIIDENQAFNANDAFDFTDLNAMQADLQESARHGVTQAQAAAQDPSTPVQHGAPLRADQYPFASEFHEPPAQAQPAQPEHQSLFGNDPNHLPDFVPASAIPNKFVSPSRKQKLRTYNGVQEPERSSTIPLTQSPLPLPGDTDWCKNLDMQEKTKEARHKAPVSLFDSMLMEQDISSLKQSLQGSQPEPQPQAAPPQQENNSAFAKPFNVAPFLRNATKGPHAPQYLPLDNSVLSLRDQQDDKAHQQQQPADPEHLPVEVVIQTNSKPKKLTPLQYKAECERLKRDYELKQRVGSRPVHKDNVLEEVISAFKAKQEATAQAQTNSPADQDLTENTAPVTQAGDPLTMAMTTQDSSVAPQSTASAPTPAQLDTSKQEETTGDSQQESEHISQATEAEKTEAKEAAHQHFTPMPSFAQTKAKTDTYRKAKTAYESTIFRRHGAPKGVPVAPEHFIEKMAQEDGLVPFEQQFAQQQKEQQKHPEQSEQDIFENLPLQLDPKSEEIVNHSFKHPEEIRRKSETSSAVTSLVNLIEKLTNTNFLDEPMTEYDRMDELRQLRRNEALTVARELHEKAENNYEKYIESIINSGKLNPDYTFEKLTWDELNSQARQKALFFLDYLEKNGLNSIALLFSGNMGSGKTCLSHAIANAYFETSLKAHRFPKYNKALPFCVITNLEEIRNTWIFDREEGLSEREERQQQFRSFCEVDILIIDTLCPDGQALDSFSQKVFAELLHQRAIKKLPIVLGLGITLESIEARLGAKCIEQLKCFQLLPVYLQGGSRRSFRLLEEELKLNTKDGSQL